MACLADESPRGGASAVDEGHVGAELAEGNERRFIRQVVECPHVWRPVGVRWPPSDGRKSGHERPNRFDWPSVCERYNGSNAGCKGSGDYATQLREPNRGESARRYDKLKVRCSLDVPRLFSGDVCGVLPTDRGEPAAHTGTKQQVVPEEVYKVEGGAVRKNVLEHEQNGEGEAAEDVAESVVAAKKRHAEKKHPEEKSIVLKVNVVDDYEARVEEGEGADD